MKPSPPKFMQRFFKWFCHEDLLVPLEGDLLELFEENVREKGAGKARLIFTLEVLKLFRPEIIKAFQMNSNPNAIHMFRYNLILTFRNFNRHKSSFLINLTGLTTGLACALLICLWVRDEINVDKFHEKDSQLYQVMRRNYSEGRIEVSRLTPGVLADALGKEMPEVEYAVNVAYPETMNTLSAGKEAIKAKGIYASSDLFNVFSFNLVEGVKSVLLDKSNMVISKDLARRLYGSENDIIGKQVTFNNKQQFTVSGIFEPNLESTIRFDFVLQLSVFEEHYPMIKFDWGNHGPDTYAVLREGVDVAQFNKKIGSILKQKANDEKNTLFARQFSKGYLYGSYENGIQKGGRIEYVKLFSIIGICILIIACINYMNLATAIASVRAKEVAMRKTMGAKRESLVFQYLSESVVLAFISLCIALALVYLILPSFNELTNKQISLNFTANIFYLFFAITFMTGILAGVYPAFYISKFKPVTIIKGKGESVFQGLSIRKGLVVFQFAISVIFIVAVLVVHSQFQMIQNRNLGYDRGNVIAFDLEGKAKVNREAYLSEVAKIPGVLKASCIANIESFFGGHSTTWGMEWPGKDPSAKVTMHYRVVDFDMIELLGMSMQDGRSFLKDYDSDLSKIIFNETAIKVMGLKEDPIGVRVKFIGREFEIVGVVKDFHFESLHESVKPMFMILFPNLLNTVMLKVSSNEINETLKRLTDFNRELNPDSPFTYYFLSDDFQKLYSGEKSVSILSKYFAGLAILLSCLGLFGLVTFTVQRRTKEIGIRKVLGSGVFNIVRMLVGDIVKMLLAAVLISFPISYLISKNWLENFVYRIDLKWWFFPGAGLSVLLIALVTVMMQTIKVASISPSEALRSE